MNTELIEQVRNGKAAIYFDINKDDKESLDKVLEAVFTDDNLSELHYASSAYYYRSRINNAKWVWDYLISEGMTAVPLHKFFEKTTTAEYEQILAEKFSNELKEDELDTYISTNRDKIDLLRQIEQWAKENFPAWSAYELIVSMLERHEGKDKFISGVIEKAYTQFAPKLHLLTK